MSWSLHTEASMDEDISAAIDLAAQDLNPQALEAIKFADEQYQQAKYAATLMASAVARPHDRISITLSGHYNQDRSPRDGWSACTIYVGISQIPFEDFELA